MRVRVERRMKKEVGTEDGNGIENVHADDEEERGIACVEVFQGF